MARPQITIKLSLEEQKSLTALAKKFRCFTDDGTPSVRPLMRQIANGFLVLSYPGSGGAKPPAEKPTESREFKFHKNSPPKWWQCGMEVEALVKKTGMPSEKLVELGFGVEQFATPPLGWRKWGAVPEWWVEGESAGMPLADAIAASGMTAKQLVAAGYEIQGQGEDREVLP